ncbi:MAG: winged helix-turn-helix domain-containing protein [Candidatus Acidiferrales bacterium]
MEGNSARRIFRFGTFEADEHTGELRKQGRRSPLQGQPLQVLLLLLDRAGELVSRTEIQQRLWPDGTFVDFDHGLNTAINKIREQLGDSASSPRFVETLARRGYRFIAPVEVVNGGPSSSPDAGDNTGVNAGYMEAQHPLPLISGNAITAVPEPRPVEPVNSAVFPTAAVKTRTLLASPEDLPQASRPVVRTLFLLLQMMYLAFYAVSLARLGIVQNVIREMVPHTLWAVVLLLVTAAVGIPVRLYLISAAAFDAPGLRERFLKIFPAIFPLDELWALAPFLLAPWIGFGAALGATAALLYVPFAQRSLILMGAGAPRGSHGA